MSESVYKFSICLWMHTHQTKLFLETKTNSCFFYVNFGRMKVSSFILFLLFQRELARHMSSHVQTFSTNEAGEYPCKECTEVFPIHHHLKEHVRLIHKPRYGLSIDYNEKEICSVCLNYFIATRETHLHCFFLSRWIRNKFFYASMPVETVLLTR